MRLSSDHTPEQALAALSVPTERTPGGMSRRRFLAGLGAAGVAGLLGGPLLGTRRAGAQAATDRNLFVLYMNGGTDGFATVMPRGDSVLRTLRPSLLLDPAQLLDLGDGFGLHPSLRSLHGRFGAGQVALVGGVGASGSLSHFASAADWMAGTPNPNDASAGTTGWVGRWLDTLGPGDDVPLRATSLTGRVPRMLVGHQSGGIGIPAGGGSLFGASRGSALESGLFSMIEGWGSGATGTTGRDHAATVGGTAASLATQVGTVLNPTPKGAAASGVLAARLFNDPGLGCRTVFAATASFDHHADLVAGHAARLADVDAIIDGLFASLTPDAASRTVALVFSEFGRRARVNGTAGTDHGTAGYAFLVGPPVQGGVHGDHLDPTRLDGNGNPYATVRHLDLIGTVLRWLGTDADHVVGTATQDLRLFA